MRLARETDNKKETPSYEQGKGTMSERRQMREKRREDVTYSREKEKCWHIAKFIL